MIPPGIHLIETMNYENKIILKPNLKLRKIGRKHMIVEIVEDCVNLTNVYSMNETAAWLWEAVGKGNKNTPKELAEGLCKEYDVDYEHALHDVEHQLEEWEKMGLLTRPDTWD